jgi:hypothetical protein
VEIGYVPYATITHKIENIHYQQNGQYLVAVRPGVFCNDITITRYFELKFKTNCYHST